MRKNRLIETQRCYHLISRLAHRAFFLTEEERSRAVDLMRRAEEFSGVFVLAYAFMANHFHIYIYVPEPVELSEADILHRIKALYRRHSLSTVLAEWNRLKEEEKEESSLLCSSESYVSRFAKYKVAFVKRMWNAAEFMRTYKQHFTMSYNGRREHCGTMWEGRYIDRNHRPEQKVMWQTAAYIDVNPMNAGISESPDEYKWCSFASACNGNSKARAGYEFMYGSSGGWETIREKHLTSIREALSEMARKRAEAAELAKKRTRESDGEKIEGRVVSNKDPMLDIPRKFDIHLERGNPRVAKKILESLAGGPMRSSALREIVGIARRDHFNNYYLRPLLQMGLIELTDPEHPRSSLQCYRLRRGNCTGDCTDRV